MTVSVKLGPLNGRIQKQGGIPDIRVDDTQLDTDEGRLLMTILLMIKHWLS